MRINPVRHALRAGKLQLGLNFGTLRSPELARLFAAAGFHWAFIDGEHGNFDLETMNDICRVANLVGFCPVVRVADLQYSLVARALDCGAQGIIFPAWRTPACSKPPSVGPNSPRRNPRLRPHGPPDRIRTPLLQRRHLPRQ